ncbi:MAG: hypothetical protein LBI01_02430 [Elusimicrobium sp.]|jgi:NADH-quinone oxidoreductase subunit L|nr:hypothetical protein [Elusimicrobium sp.]
MIILIPVLLPLICAAVVLALGKKYPLSNKILAFAGAAGALGAAVALSAQDFEMFYVNWCEGVLSFSLAAGTFEKTVVLALCFFAFIILLYAVKSKIENEKWFYFSFLFTLSFACGAALADNLVLMLFFWEGLLVSLYVFIVSTGAQSTAFKAFVLNAVGDIALLAGVILTAAAAGSFEISIIKTGPVSLLDGYGAWAFLLMCAGALAKAGAVPFHSWIPDAAEKTPAAFMAFLPSAFEKILAVFLLGRIMTFFNFSGVSLGGNILICLAVPSIIVAVVMLFKQTNLKGFIAYNIILQIGLLAFEQGVSLGGARELVNHGIYKAAALACLFLCAGIIEASAGSAAFDKIAGAFKKMKFTAACFIISSAVLCKVTFLDIFFSHTYSGLESANTAGIIFTALVYLFMLAAFLKVIAVLFKGAAQAAPVPVMLNFAAGVFAVLALLFGIGWVFDARNLFVLEHAHFNFNWVSGVSLAVILAAAALHFKAPALSPGSFAPPDFYGAARRAGLAASTGLFKTDRFFDFMIDVMPSTVIKRFSKKGSAMHTGLSISYILWALIGALVFAVLSLSGGWV